MKNLQKNEDILAVEKPSENRQPKNKWELFDITFDWWNNDNRYPCEIKQFLESNEWDEIDTFEANAVQLFDVIFYWLNDKFPYIMQDFMCSPEYQVILEVIGVDA